MYPTLTCQGLVLATAMAGTAIIFDLLREKYFPHTPHKPPLKSCLSSGSKKTEEKKKKTKKKKKKVKFAEGVKDTKGNGELYRKEGRGWHEIQKLSWNEITGSKPMPPNHVALYTGILKNRLQRIECSY